MHFGPRRVWAENGDVGGMHGLLGRPRESKGEETGKHGMGEEGHDLT